MYWLIAKIVSTMRYIYVGWNGLWWNHHVSRARLHDSRIASLEPNWREHCDKG